MWKRRLRFSFGSVGLAGLIAVRTLPAADCSVTSTGPTPISDLGSGLYLGLFQGGLYPGGVNSPPSVHEAEGILQAMNVIPLDAMGDPSPTGSYVLLSIGMSNTTQEFCSQSSFEPCDAWTFMGQAAVDPRVNQSTLVIANGARGGQAATVWDDPSESNYDRVRDEVLAPKGLTEAQVQVLWIKQANIGPTIGLPNINADVYALETNLGNIVRAAKVRYPNLRIAFLSSRIYAGYAVTSLNREPFAYESAFSVKWLIEAQINQNSGGPIDPVAGNLDLSVAPWLSWGPYLWADGLVPRSDGLIWECGDLVTDGTHPSTSGEQKVGTMLLDFLLESSFAQPWFRAPALIGDCDESYFIDLLDYSTFSGCMGGPGAKLGPSCLCGDWDADADSDMVDFLALQTGLTASAPTVDPAFDDFERAALGNQWQVLSGTPSVVGGSDLGVTAGGISQVVWVGSNFNANQFCEVEISADWNPLTNFQLNARVNLNNGAQYGLRLTSTGMFELRYADVGVNTLLATAPATNVGVGDRVRIQVQGAIIQGLVNGNLAISANHGTLADGAVGMSMAPENSAPTAYFELWSGGSLTTSP